MGTLNYENIWKEFAGKWGFSTSPIVAFRVGNYSFIRSHNCLELLQCKQDRRTCSGVKLVAIFSTEDANEMREYLINNSSSKNSRI